MAGNLKMPQSLRASRLQLPKVCELLSVLCLLHSVMVTRVEAKCPNTSPCLTPTGLFPVDGDCTGFYNCAHCQPHRLTCPPGTVFDHTMRICNHELSVDCTRTSGFTHRKPDPDEDDGAVSEIQKPKVTTTPTLAANRKSVAQRTELTEDSNGRQLSAGASSPVDGRRLEDVRRPVFRGDPHVTESSAVFSFESSHSIHASSQGNSGYSGKPNSHHASPPDHSSHNHQLPPPSASASGLESSPDLVHSQTLSFRSREDQPDDNSQINIEFTFKEATDNQHLQQSSASRKVPSSSGSETEPVDLKQGNLPVQRQHQESGYVQRVAQLQTGTANTYDNGYRAPERRTSPERVGYTRPSAQSSVPPINHNGSRDCAQHTSGSVPLRPGDGTDRHLDHPVNDGQSADSDDSRERLQSPARPSEEELLRLFEQTSASVEAGRFPLRGGRSLADKRPSRVARAADSDILGRRMNRQRRSLLTSSRF